jgi:hypothetical protein
MAQTRAPPALTSNRSAINAFTRINEANAARAKSAQQPLRWEDWAVWGGDEPRYLEETEKKQQKSEIRGAEMKNSTLRDKSKRMLMKVADWAVKKWDMAMERKRVRGLEEDRKREVADLEREKRGGRKEGYEKLE